LVEAMHSQGISGESFMKLESDDVGVVQLLVALRAAASAPRISFEDKQLYYSCEKLKVLRVCFLMSGKINCTSKKNIFLPRASIIISYFCQLCVFSSQPLAFHPKITTNLSVK
jgi:hypothetical protein